MKLKFVFPKVSTGMTQGKVTLNVRSQVGQVSGGASGGVLRRGDARMDWAK